jgi:hypothetical protein
MKVTFIIWYNHTTPQIVDVLKSIISSAGPTKISIIAAKTSIGKQSEDSAVRWIPGCELMYMPGYSRKMAWQGMIKKLISGNLVSTADYITICDPYFIAETPIFNEHYPDNAYRVYIPYSNCYGEKKPEPTNRLVKTNGGGPMLMVGRHAFYNFRSLPVFLENYCLDYYMIDHLALMGYTCHKMPGCYVKSIPQPPQNDKEKIAFFNDLSNYEIWTKSKGGYNTKIAAQLRSAKIHGIEDLYSEENSD